MAHYYKYDFISPGPTFAIVKEELKSYFDTGVVDDLMFPTYLTKCMQKLSRATLPILETPLFVEDFEARLPDNFHAAREVWLCTEVPLSSYKDPSSFYSQSGTCTIQIRPVTVGGNSCDGRCAAYSGCPECGDMNDIQDCESLTSPDCVPCTEDPDCGNLEQGIYKTSTYNDRAFRQSYLLRPGNISANKNCSLDYNKNWTTYGQTPGSDRIDSFDIRDNKLITNFRNGTIHLIFYGELLDNDNRTMLPDNYRIKEYVETFIKYKMLETISNQVNDETFNQIQQKMMYYKALADEAFIMASIEVKKETIEKKARKIYKDKTRLRGFEKITSSRNRYGRNRYNRNNF